MISIYGSEASRNDRGNGAIWDDMRRTMTLGGCNVFACIPSGWCLDGVSAYGLDGWEILCPLWLYTLVSRCCHPSLD